jgi:NhaP-type Na+/H+ or K+/H+ antiporter
VTTNQILIGIGLILVLAVGAQVLATRLHIPAIIVLLPTGFVAGALTTDVNPDKLLGPAFEPLVSLSVAVRVRAASSRSLRSASRWAWPGA